MPLSAGDADARLDRRELGGEIHAGRPVTALVMPARNELDQAVRLRLTVDYNFLWTCWCEHQGTFPGGLLRATRF